jgi:hypothetical protein
MIVVVLGTSVGTKYLTIVTLFRTELAVSSSLARSRAVVWRRCAGTPHSPPMRRFDADGVLQVV